MKDIYMQIFDVNSFENHVEIFFMKDLLWGLKFFKVQANKISRLALNIFNAAKRTKVVTLVIIECFFDSSEFIL